MHSIPLSARLKHCGRRSQGPPYESEIQRIQTETLPNRESRIMTLPATMVCDYSATCPRTPTRKPIGSIIVKRLQDANVVINSRGIQSHDDDFFACFCLFIREITGLIAIGAVLEEKW